MFARRALHRSSSIFLNRVPPVHNRSLCITPVTRQAFTRQAFGNRPTGLAAKIWFRSDGTPRSKWKGLAIGTVTIATLAIMYTMLDMMEELETANYLLSCLIHIQRVDVDFSSLDVSDPSSVLVYFGELCSSFTNVPQNMIDDFFEDVKRLVALPGQTREEAHEVMQNVCHKIHDILVQSTRKHPWETAVEVMNCLDEGITKLADMIEDTLSEGQDDVILRNQKIKEHKTKDYEVIG